MANTTSINLDEAEKLLRGHMGLICGPGLTRPGATYPSVAALLAEKFDLAERSDYLTAGQLSLAGREPDDVSNVIRSFIENLDTFPNIQRVGNLRWSAVLSLALDSSLESEIRRACERRTSGLTVTEITRFPQVPPQKTIPVFKLLGSLDSQNFVYSQTGYTMRRPTWRYPVREFADRVKTAPVFCLGLTDCLQMLVDLLAEMLTEPRTSVAPLLFVASEFDDRAQQTIVEVAGGRSNVYFITASLTDVVARLKDVDKAGPVLGLPFSTGDKNLDRLAPYQGLIVLVNSQLKSSVLKEETAQLTDLLFSPALPRWDPFYHNLDFRRTIGARIFDAVSRAPRKGRTDPAFILTGGAASGKTTIAKRVAFDLAAKGHIVMWFRRGFFPNTQSLLADFFRVLAEVTDKTKRYYLFIDDPVGLGSISVRSIASAARAKGIHCTFLISLRTSDWKTHEVEEMTGGLDIVEEFEIADHFEKDELEALPNYLLRLNICTDKAAAKKEIAKAPSRNPSDTLGLLYFLLPKTRRSIEASIHEEYIRLGEQAGLSRIVIGAYERTSEFLRSAYAMVAVADHYHTPVPLEVLVSALGVSYNSWLETVGQEGAAWGLLYGEPSADGETTVYRPRNAVVTRILIEAINGGKFGHAGEVQNLVTLIRACSGTSPIYREFCVGILVPADKLSNLDYHDGAQLYDAALEALPLEDRTIVHQKGVWIKDKGKDPLLAKSVLDQALTTKVYPYTTRGEADQHIHTSIAATLVDAINNRQIALEEAIPEIRWHVEQARSHSFFNPRAVHVQANLMLRVLAKFEERDTADTYNLVNEALLAVDAALLVLKNPLKPKAARATKDIDLLEEVTGKIFEKVIPLDELKESAKLLFDQFKRQDGFVIAARKMYHVAREKNSGSAYKEAFSYCESVMEQIEKNAQAVAPDLSSIAVCVYYEWNINRYDAKATGRTINWKMLHALSGNVLKAEKYRVDPFYRYVCGIALAQQGLWSEAEAFFAQNRNRGIPNDQLFQIRALLLDSQGLRQNVQGRVSGTGSRRYLFVDSLQKDFNVSRDERWPNVGETAHAFIAFAFGGFTAVQQP